jgi:hypothetical protein
MERKEIASYGLGVSRCLSSLGIGIRLTRFVDMAIAVPGVVVSTNDVISIENSLDSLFDLQNETTGQLQYAGSPFPAILSFTYHLYTLIGVADHYLYTVSLSVYSYPSLAEPIHMGLEVRVRSEVCRD